MPYRVNKPKLRASTPRRMPLYIVIVLIGLLAAGLGVAHFSRLFHHQSPVTSARPSGSENTKGEQPAGSTTSGASSGTTQSGDNNKDDNGGTAAVVLVSPTGDFVSAHHVSLATPIASTCNTTPGAACIITFTSASGAVTKSLAPETADRNGSVYWNNWTPKSIGLTAGTWHIRATASLSGQTRSADDALDLAVQP
jgi:hypothetical protein